MQQRRLRVFVASSSENLHLAHSLQENLDREFELTVWNQGVFALSRPTLETLLQTPAAFDAAIFVFAPDDLATIRGTTNAVVRDNVIFELGLFIGRLGRDRTFLIIPRASGLHLPTDLIGMTPAEYSADRSDQNWNAALGPACNQIRRALANMPNLDSNTLTRQLTGKQREILAGHLTPLNDRLIANGKSGLAIDLYWINAGDCAEYARQFADFFRTLRIRSSTYTQGALSMHLGDDYFYGIAIRWNKERATSLGVSDLGDQFALAMREAGIEATVSDDPDYAFLDLIIGARKVKESS